MTTESQPTPRVLLRAHGLRCTSGRAAILAALLQAARPLRPDEIAARLVGQRRLNKVTIYRALESFVAAGLVHEAFLQERVSHYELAHHCGHIKCHPHFTCTGCGKTRCLMDAQAPSVTNLPAGYQVTRQQVRLEGLCPQCSDPPVTAAANLAFGRQQM